MCRVSESEEEKVTVTVVAETQVRGGAREAVD
jgi:hypothetical protein